MAAEVAIWRQKGHMAAEGAYGGGLKWLYDYLTGLYGGLKWLRGWLVGCYAGWPMKALEELQPKVHSGFAAPPPPKSVFIPIFVPWQRRFRKYMEQYTDRFPSGKRYNSFVGYFKRVYGERLQKVVIDAGFTCPNRDGTVGVGGCSYCDNAAFHPAYSNPRISIAEQIDEGIKFHKVRYRNAKNYLAYFQSFSNTYAPVSVLREKYLAALAHPSVAGIVIGTRPDCVDDEKLDFLASLARGEGLPDNKSIPWSREVGGKILEAPIVVVEYGIESCLDRTLSRINRGHDFECAKRAVEMTAARGLDVGAHFILGLPGESIEDMLSQAEAINALPLRSVKFHQLQLVRGTAIEKEFARRPEDFAAFTLDEYIDFFADMLERLRPDLYIERIAGEVPPRFVANTPWGLIRNAELLRLLDSRLEARQTWQGRLCPGEPQP